MKNILVIQSSPRGAESNSNKLVHAVVAKIQAKHHDAKVKTIDLAKHPLPHLEEAHLAAFFAPAEKHTAANKEAIRHSETAIADIMHADTIVIGVPMYNFGIPSTLKAWVDHLARAGVTFRYTANGPEGLIKGKKVFLSIASGGVYSEGAYKPYDFTEVYLRAVLGFLGMTDVTAYRAEGFSVEALKASALDKAVALIHI